MTEIRLAANYVDIASAFGNFGHLQIVYVDDAGNEIELEVQGPWDFVFGADWIFEPRADGLDRNHATLDNTPHYGDANFYGYTTFLVGQAADDAWNILSQTHGQFITAQIQGVDFDYQIDYGSNSYATTLLSIIGIDIGSLLPRITVPSITNGFPGEGRNALNDAGHPDDAIDLELVGSSGANIIVTGNGTDTLEGGDGADQLHGGGGDDQLYGTYDASGSSSGAPIDDDEDGDYLVGGDGNDTYVVGFSESVARKTHNPVNGAGGKTQLLSGLEGTVDVVKDSDELGEINYTDLDGNDQTIKDQNFGKVWYDVVSNGWSNQGCSTLITCIGILEVC